MLVMRNVPTEGSVEHDTIMPRTIVDTGIMSGIGEFLNAEVAIASLLPVAPYIDSVNLLRTREELIEVLMTYHHFIRWTVAHTNIRGMSRGPRAAIARAMIVFQTSPEKTERLHEFCQVVVHGIPVSPNGADDIAAIVFRNLVMTTSGKGRQKEMELYRKGQTAIDHFMNRNKVTRLYGTDVDMYPFPEPEIGLRWRGINSDDKPE
jgi:hypothetical protein